IGGCLCISTLPTFVVTNAVAMAAVTISGKAYVLTELENIVNTAASASGCAYPDHAIPVCGSGTCGFSCGDGFSVSEGACVCSAPNLVCNGEYEGSGSCSVMGSGWMACGVSGGSGRAFECVNTANDLESCGGCALPLSPYQKIGQDCTAIPGVADVQCLSSSCVIHRCTPGFAPADDAPACIRTHSSSGQHVYPVADSEMVDIPAKLYGLEHGHYVA
ncbi:uncharacterized protein STEHIDRAFT_66492, partial [Stereum hirsutum FP-91666 SS1]|uniref:uncharacterized protein n=1 Tax=Stereum hirsutum (strain FP-91666) TaxID=721885 RepID=UPI0004449A85